MLIFVANKDSQLIMESLKTEQSFVCRHPEGQLIYLAEHLSLPASLNPHRQAIEILDKHDDYPLVAKRNIAHEVKIGDVTLGDGKLQLIAGPCSVESEDQLIETAKQLNKLGIKFMRGGAYKPRTSPYSFQGLGHDGLKLMQDVAKMHDLHAIVELMDVRLLDTFLEAGVSAIQIGSRNMQNYDLLKAVGRTKIPVILKRGLAATIKEWLLAAEYIAAQGNSQIILCERGVRSFEPSYRNMLDITAIPVAKKETHLPVIVDPSHAAGRTDLVAPLAKAAVAAGADGLLIEIHPQPSKALSDKDQALSFNEFEELVRDLKLINRAPHASEGSDELEK